MSTRKGVGLVGLFGIIVLAFWLGVKWEGSRCYDTYVYWFCRYSAHLMDLTRRQEISELTNSIVKFDTMFRPKQDAQTLQAVMQQLLKAPDMEHSKTNAAVMQSDSRPSND